MRAQCLRSPRNAGKRAEETETKVAETLWGNTWDVFAEALYSRPSLDDYIAGESTVSSIVRNEWKTVSAFVLSECVLLLLRTKTDKRIVISYETITYEAKTPFTCVTSCNRLSRMIHTRSEPKLDLTGHIVTCIDDDRFWWFTRCSTIVVQYYAIYPHANRVFLLLFVYTIIVLVAFLLTNIIRSSPPREINLHDILNVSMILDLHRWRIPLQRVWPIHWKQYVYNDMLWSLAVGIFSNSLSLLLE